jgi:hypothetical protein
MFPGTSPALMNYHFFARWDPGTKNGDILITGNGTVIVKPNEGTGGAKGTKPRIKT